MKRNNATKSTISLNHQSQREKVSFSTTIEYCKIKLSEAERVETGNHPDPTVFSKLGSFGFLFLPTSTEQFY